MGTKLLPQVRTDVYTFLITHPALSDYQIADKFGISRGFVYNLRQKFVRKLDYELAQNIAGAFLADYQHASDYFKLQTTELENEKVQLRTIQETAKKTIFRKNEQGDTYAEQVDLDAMDKLQINRDIRDIMKQQTDLWKNVIFLARQGEAVQIMKLVQSGRIHTDN